MISSENCTKIIYIITCMEQNSRGKCLEMKKIKENIFIRILAYAFSYPLSFLGFACWVGLSWFKSKI